MGLKLTKAGDYGIRAMIHLACLPEDRTASSCEIADAQKIPGSFMAKILRNLVRAGLLRSSRGASGGFSLAKPASEINLLDVVEAIDGPLSITSCVPDPSGCDASCDCPASRVWLEVYESVRGILERANLEELVSTPRRNGRVAASTDLVAAG